MSISYLRRGFGFLVGITTLAALGCTDEEIVYVERPPFNDPADASSGFLGYYTSATQQTTCGNCHADFQGTWAETGHAGAYNTLHSNPGAQDFCYSCHTVTANGNAATGDLGYDAVQDSTYYDVQCESCHGPGLEHVQGVNQGQLVRPLASIAVSVDATNGCGECHNDTHHPFVEQWATSRHAMIREDEVTNPNCVRCHEGRGALKNWGVTSNYLERDEATAYQATTCAVCHNPHGSPNTANLRFSVSDPDPTSNLCIKCHLNRAEPVGGSSRGNQPHGAQGGVLLGFAGWRPPDFAYDTARIFGTHATTANPNLCAGCHVQRFTVTDPASGNFVFQSVGHLFRPIPCVDAQGIPTDDNSCAYTAAARNWSPCTNSGCHANADVAANLFNSTRAEIDFLVGVLWVDTDHDQTIDAYPTDDGYLAKIKLNAPADLNSSDQIITAADGSEFNARTCGENLAGHPDGSKGTHNKFLCQALLAQSASYLKSIYAFLPSPPAQVQAIIDKWRGPMPSGPGQPVIRRENFPAMK
jgi:predicted CXXCH cytochrome family protein